jgi:hypothetical protein
MIQIYIKLLEVWNEREKINAIRTMAKTII